jgi:hypothetical protein
MSGSRPRPTGLVDGVSNVIETGVLIGTRARSTDCFSESLADGVVLKGSLSGRAGIDSQCRVPKNFCLDAHGYSVPLGDQTGC